MKDNELQFMYAKVLKALLSRNEQCREQQARIEALREENECLSISLDVTRNSLGDTREELNKAEIEIEQLKDNNKHLAVLLNKANAEIEKISKLLKLEAEGANTLNDVIAERDAEIERLKDGCSNCTVVQTKSETICDLHEQIEYWQRGYNDIRQKLKTANSEAIKDFAYGLHKRLRLFYDVDNGGRFEAVKDVDIDNLVKEMTGEQL